MPTKSFHEYLQTRLSEKEIVQIEERANAEVAAIESITRSCSNCKKNKLLDQFIKNEHKTCANCIMRIRRWERKNKRYYTGHQY